MSPSGSSERIVAIGLLTQRDIDVLGSGFRRLFPLTGDQAFDELLGRLDAIEHPAPKLARQG